jgi:transcriptional regulator with XRE-family HTH domain
MAPSVHPVVSDRVRSITIVVDDIEARMAERLRARRAELRLSLGHLAARSGVSKAMIAKVEAGTSSPTAGVLGRLCMGLGITMSALMAAVEGEDATQSLAADQPRWRDPDTDLERIAVSPRTSFGAVEIARLRLPAGTTVDYPAPPSVAFAQHLLGVRGKLRFTLGQSSFVIKAGDCVAARIDRPTRFEVLGGHPAEYFVIVEQAKP